MRTTLHLDEALIVERDAGDPVVLPTSPGSPRAGVVLDDNAALRDVMDDLG